MRRVLGRVAATAVAVVVGTGCNAARDIKDAAQGLSNLETNAKELEARLARSKELTYTATYERTGTDGRTEEVVIAQKPPKSMYRQGETLLVDDGQTIFSCSKSDGNDRCEKVGDHTEDGIYGAGLGFGFAFSPAAVLGLYTTAALTPGVEAGKSSRDIAGQRSECVSVRFTEGSEKDKRFESCTTDDGIFSFSDDGEGNVVTLTRYEKDAADSLFALPDQAGPADSTSTTTGSTTTTTRPSRSSASSTTTSTSRSSSSTTSTSTPTGGPDMSTTG